jgi:hypothetical protein
LASALNAPGSNGGNARGGQQALAPGWQTIILARLAKLLQQCASTVRLMTAEFCRTSSDAVRKPNVATWHRNGATSACAT